MNDIDKLIARDEIKQQLYKYCRSVDQQNWQDLRTCFGLEHVHKHGTYSGDLDGFIDFVKLVGERISAAHHCISNLVIELDDDNASATSEAYFTSVHRLYGNQISKMYFFCDDMQEVDSDWMVAGIYSDRWVFRDHKWVIVERNARHVWERVEPVTPESL